MLRKILCTIVLFILCSSNSYAGNGFFIEGGIGSRLIDGSISFSSDSNNPTSQSGGWGYTKDANGFGWRTNLLWNVNFAVGTQLSENSITSLSFQYVTKKTGFQPIMLFNGFDSTEVSSVGEFSFQEFGSMYHISNTYQQFNIQLIQNIYLNNSLFIIGGIEFAFLIFQKENLNTEQVSGENIVRIKTSPYIDNTIGVLAGLGYEYSISSKTALMGSGTYTYSKYKGNGLSFGGLNLNLSGFELGFKLRYYLK